MITNIEELKAKKYLEVELPGWDIDDKFTCKLQRVNLLDLAAKGKIPNPLMGTVIELFKGNGPQPDNADGLKVLGELSNLFCDICMVEPNYKDVDEAIGLTDEQKMIIYNFALKGVRALEPFLKNPSNTRIGRNGPSIQKKSE